MAVPLSTHLATLASELSARRDLILQAWRRAVAEDPRAESGVKLSRAQFFDHIPQVLDAFEQRLRAPTNAQDTDAEDESRRMAAEHGIVRWQQGYRLQEVMQDWGSLHLCLLRELERCAADHPEVPNQVMSIARTRLAQLCNEGVSQSAVEYANLERTEAAGRLTALEQALVRLQDLEQQRAQSWREAAHDLRGRAHAIASASAVLTRDGVPEQHRTRFSEMLRLGVQSLNKLLGDLMDQARLEAGHERRQITHFDVAATLKEYCDTTRSVAADKGLFLVARGAESLMVDGDPAKIQRIVQNLVLNALKVTERGGVKVTWEASDNVRRPQWALCVQDTGPGFKRGSATPLERALKRATDDAHEVEQQNVAPSQSDPQADSAPTLASQTTASRGQAPAGEGIGLSIVKRLCEMLDASLELESSEGEGTTFRIVFPRRYPEATDTD